VTFTGYDDVGPTTTDVHVLLGVVPLFNGNITAYGANPGGTAPYAQNGLLLAANDFIDFAVGWGSNQNYLYDTTGIAASLASETDGNRVPEPATLGLLAIGLGVLISARSRKKVALRSR
jgi:PEP-CTERM motif